MTELKSSESRNNSIIKNYLKYTNANKNCYSDVHVKNSTLTMQTSIKQIIQILIRI